MTTLKSCAFVEGSHKIFDLHACWSFFFLQHSLILFIKNPGNFHVRQICWFSRNEKISKMKDKHFNFVFKFYCEIILQFLNQARVHNVRMVESFVFPSREVNCLSQQYILFIYFTQCYFISAIYTNSYEKSQSWLPQVLN